MLFASGIPENEGTMASFLGSRFRQRVLHRMEAALLGLLGLGRNVDLAGGVFADDHNGETRLRPAGRHQFGGVPGDGADDVVAYLPAVDDLRHDVLRLVRRSRIVTKNRRCNPDIAPFGAVNSQPRTKAAQPWRYCRRSSASSRIACRTSRRPSRMSATSSSARSGMGWRRCCTGSGLDGRAAAGQPRARTSAAGAAATGA